MKFTSRSLVLFFGLFTCVSLSQNDIYQGIKKLPLTDAQKMTKIDSLLNSNLTNDNLSDLEIVSRKYSNWLFKKGRFKKAVTSLAMSIEYHSGDSLALQKKLYNAGHFSFKAKDYPQSIEYYKKTISINETNNLAASAHNELGRNYYFLGDLYLSIQYFETAEKLLLRLENYQELYRGYMISFNSYRDLKTKTALKKLYSNLTTADSLAHNLNMSLDSKYLVLRVLGKYHFIDKKNVDTVAGMKALGESLKYAKEMKDSLKFAGVLGEMGILFNSSNLKKSTDYFTTALTFFPKGSQDDLAVIYSNIGRNQAKLGEFESALANQNKALQLVLNDSVEIDRLSASERGKLWKANKTQDYLWEISSFKAETHLLMYEKTRNKKDLEKSVSYFKTTDEIFDSFTQNVSEFNSKLQWRKNATESYGRALKACYYANDVESAFFFMEKNKAILLTEAIDKQRTNRSFNLPKQVYELEMELKNSIIQQEKRLEIDGPNVSISEDLLRKKERLSSYWDSISSLYPSYIPMRTTRILTLKELQANLDTNETVISYHLSVDDGAGIYGNTDNGYVLIITKDNTYLEEIPNLYQLKEDVRLLTESLKIPFKTQEDALDYYAISNQLYLRLFPSEEIRKQLMGQKISVVADNYLSLIPFEALSQKADEPAYLIQNCEIHYLYSNSFLENNKKVGSDQNSFLGMAPTNFSELELPSLAYSAMEIESLNKYYSGNSLLNEEASKDTFITELPNHGIIHLATHANAQDSIAPWIAFYDDKISLDELYLTHNNASLVVLSGCNTTLGEQAVGEGVMSLARGFFYSGARSVMSTLWSIDDKSTATITKDFYKNLEAGQHKSEALHNAKLNYLQTHSLSEASPYYWASFIMLGENGTLQSDPSYWPYISVLAIGIFIILLIRRRRK